MGAHHGVDELQAILAALHNREQTLANVRNFPSRGNTSVNRKIEILKLLKDTASSLVVKTQINLWAKHILVFLVVRSNAAVLKARRAANSSSAV